MYIEFLLWFIIQATFMNDEDLKTNKNPNTTPSGLPNLPVPIVGAAYKKEIDFDEGVNSFAIIGLILGLVSFFLWDFLGLAAIVFSLIALSQLKKYKKRGKLLAIIGLCLGIINFCFFILEITII